MATPERVASLSVRLPRLRIRASTEAVPLLPADATGPVHVWRDRAGRIVAYGYAGGDARWMHIPGLATFRFDHLEDVIAWSPVGVSEQRIGDVYARAVLPFVLQSAGLEVLHASAVLGERGVTAFCGASETGKSTLAYGLHRRGYRLWADDVVAFRPCGGRVLALPLPFTARLRPQSAAFFAEDDRASVASRGSDSPAGAVPAPLTSVFVLTRVPRSGKGGAARVHRLSGGRALSAVLAHAQSFSMDTLARRRHLVADYLELIARVRVFELHFVARLDRLSEVLDAIELTIA